MDTLTLRPGRTRVRSLLAALVLGLVLAQPAFAGAPAGVVNVNTASVEQLTRLPGVGEARAREIVALRQKRGAFRKVDDLRAVRGIGEASLEKLRPFVSLQGKTTLPPQ